MAFVYIVIFGRFARFPSGNVHYPLFIVGGLLPWQYFSSSVTSGAASLVSNVNLVTKVYFPRLLLPLATVFVPVARLPARPRRAGRDDGLVRHLAASAPRSCWRPRSCSSASFRRSASRCCCRRSTSATGTCPYAIPVFLQVLPARSPVFRTTISGLPEHWQTDPGVQPDDDRGRRLALGHARLAAARDRHGRRRRVCRRRGAGGRVSPTSVPPSPASRTRSDERRAGDRRPRASPSVTGSASSRRATARCGTRSSARSSTCRPGRASRRRPPRGDLGARRRLVRGRRG